MLWRAQKFWRVQEYSALMTPLLGSGLSLVQGNLPLMRDCIKAIERYVVMPGQATAYKIGMLKILELREDAKRRLGDRFDIRGFHDTILANGPVPLSILESLVDEWVESRQ